GAGFCSRGLGDKRRQRSMFLVDKDLSHQMLGRLRPWLPEAVLGGALLGIDRCWEVHRIEPGDCQPFEDLLSHSASRTAGAQATVILFLNHGVQGGGLRCLSPTSEKQGAKLVLPEQGSALLVALHGDQLQKPLLEVLPVQGGSLHLLRLAVLYETIGAETQAPEGTSVSQSSLKDEPSQLADALSPTPEREQVRRRGGAPGCSFLNVTCAPPSALLTEHRFLLSPCALLLVGQYAQEL
ncbi:unnamed protein product, partial [Polarella glacialis]